jgi:hypothetical protein
MGAVLNRRGGSIRKDESIEVINRAVGSCSKGPQMREARDALTNADLHSQYVEVSQASATKRVGPFQQRA